MKLAHNPQTYVIGYLSMMRNMFLTSSIALAAMGFSKNFDKYETFIKILALIIFFYSMANGYKGAKDFSTYIDYMNKHKQELPEPYNFQLEQWQGWITLTYIYIFILCVISFFILFRKIA